MSFFWLVFAVLLWGYFHSLFATLQFKGLLRRTFGPQVDRFFRLAYNLFAGVSFVAVLAVAAVTPDRTLYVVPFPWVGLMIIAEFLAIAALVVALRQTDMLDFIGLRQVTSPKPKQPASLVTDGLYRYVRHPLYSAGLVLIWLIPLMTARVLVIDLSLTVYIVIGAYLEERKLRHKFGHDYVVYTAVTPMFIPFLKKLRLRAPM